MDELNKKFAEVTKQPVQDWSSESVKIDITALNLTATQAKAALEKITGWVSSEFYAVSDQDPYMYYYHMLRTPNVVIMQAIIDVLTGSK